MSAPVLTPGEEWAEKLFYAAISRNYAWPEFMIECRFLEREHPDGSCILALLTYKIHSVWDMAEGGQWPAETGAARY